VLKNKPPYSKDCETGWFCNFDFGETGFCESCGNFPTPNDCIKTGFIDQKGTQECFDVCHVDISNVDDQENHDVHRMENIDAVFCRIPWNSVLDSSIEIPIKINSN